LIGISGYIVSPSTSNNMAVLSGQESVGEAEGADVDGDALGAALGEPVGEAVGAVVGEAVGDEVGGILTLGESVGSLLG
jgi:phage tail tape-measure protein